MKNVLLISLSFLLTCCAIPNNDKSSARANSVNGLIVFVNASPNSPYSIIGSVKHEALAEIFKAGSNKNFGKALGDILSKTTENVTLQQQLLKMTELAKNQYPQSEAIIINSKIFEAQAIRFN
jgi:hypothetical protein